MKDYGNMNQREINLRLHTLLRCPKDIKFLNMRGNYAFWGSPSGEICEKYDPKKVKNYSGDVAELWPLMIANNIAITPLPDYQGKFSADRVISVEDVDGDYYTVGSDISYQDYNPLKAASIVLLMALGDE